MHKITVKSKSEIWVGASLSNIKEYLPNGQVVIVTDTNIYDLYASQFSDYPVVTIGTGESVKNLETVQYIIDKLIDLQSDRHTFLLGIGGGVVCDIVGFVASIFMRGIRFGFVSTSLLSQIDASVGGKNGVNFNAYKNMIGNFNQPQFVICDTQMLKTLPHKEWLSGMGELLKHALISDADMFKVISQKAETIFDADDIFWKDLIYRNIQIKAAVVEQDEKEQGERKKLNLGHTLAHAIENQKEISHGHAVALGLIFSAKVANSKQYLSDNELSLIIQTIQKMGFDTHLSLDKQQLKRAILNDKKKQQSHLDFVMLKAIGKVEVQSVDIEQINQWIDDLC